MLSWLKAEIPKDSLEYLLACYRKGGFAENPISRRISLEETFYALWALREIGFLAEISVDEVKAFLEKSLWNSSRLSDLYYAYMGLYMLGYCYNISDRLQEYYRLDGSFAPKLKIPDGDPYATYMGISLAKLSGFRLSEKSFEYAKGVESPALRTLLMDILGLLDSRRARALANEILQGRLGFWEILALKVLSKHTFSVRLTIKPKVVVNEPPKVVFLEAYSLLGEELKATYTSKFYRNSTLVVWITANGIERKLSFRIRRVKRIEVYVIIRSEKGFLSAIIYVSPSYANPEVKMVLAGREYEATRIRDEAYSIKIKHGLKGEFPVTVIASSENCGFVEVKGIVTLEPPCLSVHPSPAPLVILIGLAPIIAGSIREKRKFKIAALLAPSIALFKLIPLIDPSVVRLLGGSIAYELATSGVPLALLTLVADRRALRATAEWVLIVGLVLASVALSGNPLLMIVAGIGLGVFAFTIWLYPNEFSLVYRTATSIMLFWSLATLVLALVIKVVTAIATMLAYVPDLGFLNAVYVNATMIANFIVLLPIVASLYTLMRLYMTSKRAREAARLLEELRC